METEATRDDGAQRTTRRERGQRLVEARRRSALSQRAFAREQQVPPHLIAYWARQFPRPAEATARAVPADAAPPFVEVAITKPTSSPSAHVPSGSAIDVLLSCGAVVRVVRGVDCALLRTVVSALAGERC